MTIQQFQQLTRAGMPGAATTTPATAPAAPTPQPSTGSPGAAPQAAQYVPGYQPIQLPAGVQMVQLPTQQAQAVQYAQMPQTVQFVQGPQGLVPVATSMMQTPAAPPGFQWVQGAVQMPQQTQSTGNPSTASAVQLPQGFHVAQPGIQYAQVQQPMQLIQTPQGIFQIPQGMQLAFQQPQAIRYALPNGVQLQQQPMMMAAQSVMQAQPPPPPPPPRGAPQQPTIPKQKIMPKPSPSKGVGFNASLNPKAEPFVPKTNAQTSPPGKPTTTSTTPTVTAPVTCPVCGDTGFITHNVLRSHMKAKHPNVPEPKAEEQPPQRNSALHSLIASFIAEKAGGGGSIPLSQLQEYLMTHAQEYDAESALQHATSFVELIKSLGFVVFAYTEEQLNERHIAHSFIPPNEPRVALGTEFSEADTVRAQGHQE
jgi:hypothetical protein